MEEAGCDNVPQEIEQAYEEKLMDIMLAEKQAESQAKVQVQSQAAIMQLQQAQTQQQQVQQPGPGQAPQTQTPENANRDARMGPNTQQGVDSRFAGKSPAELQPGQGREQMNGRDAKGRPMK